LSVGHVKTAVAGEDSTECTEHAFNILYIVCGVCGVYGVLYVSSAQSRPQVMPAATRELLDIMPLLGVLYFIDNFSRVSLN